MRAEVEQALAALQKGQPGAAEKAIALLQNTVFSFSMKMCGNREDAEDTMQETLLKAALHLPSFSSPKALAVWLYKVAKNQCLMSRRKSKFAPRQQLSLEVLMPDAQDLERMAGGGNAPAPDRILLREENAEQLQRAMLKLPPDYRLLVVLHDMEELSTEEVARIIGLQEGTVRVRLHRARLLLRNALTGKASPPRHSPRLGTCKKLFLELSNYLNDELDQSLCTKLERHLSGCDACKNFLESLQSTVSLLRRHKPPALTPEAARQVRAAILAEYRRAMKTANRARPAASA
jgi:RNA polymerase sigma-70 factor, ECF subfamily